MAKVNAKGVTALPNEIQNIQTNSNPSNFDSTHIICKDDGTIDVKGFLIFQQPQALSSEIISPDIASNITCLNGQQISISTSNPAGFNNGGITVDGQPFSQQMICYGVANTSYGVTVAGFTFSINAPNTEAGIPSGTITVKCYIMPNMTYWFSTDRYNEPDNNIIVYNGTGFNWTYADRAMVDVEITWQLNLQGVGNISQTLCIGLYDTIVGLPLPESIQWQQFAGNVGSKYLTFKTHFTTKRATFNKLVPFYQQSTDPSYFIYNSSVSGVTASSIRFNMQQCIAY